jgi:serine-type D-Ala-D-Ala carboxypeptidase/endopeptidase (penicillin-binding protein 4)
MLRRLPRIHRTVSLAAAIAAVLLIGLSLWLVPRTSEASTEAAEAALRNRISAILDDPARPSALWGVYVQNLRTGQVVYSRNADLSLIPASVMKLLTTAVALETYGPDYRFTTNLYFNGEAGGDVLKGDLIIRGSGDPTFGSALSTGSPLAHWARTLAGMGVRRIEGRIIGDASAMASEPFAPGWDIDHIATSAWAQAISGLSYADNLVTLELAGTQAGRDATVRDQPAGYVQIQNRMTTRGGRGFSPMRIERHIGTNDVTVAGSVSASYRGSIRLPIHDPARFALHSFVNHLQQAGIEVRAQLLTVGDLDEAPSYGSDPILVHVSPRLIDILTVINQRSNNFFAEQIFRALSAGGSPRGSAQRIVSYLQGAGVSTAGLSARDGSGLSRKNLVTAQTLGGLLAHVYQSEHRDLFIGTLARGGQPGTTMRFRLGGAPVWGKTGTLENVRGLAGYATGADNTPYVFVMLANNYTASPAIVGQAQDNMVAAITGAR